MLFADYSKLCQVYSSSYPGQEMSRYKERGRNILGVIQYTSFQRRSRFLQGEVATSVVTGTPGKLPRSMVQQLGHAINISGISVFLNHGPILILAFYPGSIDTLPCNLTAKCKLPCNLIKSNQGIAFNCLAFSEKSLWLSHFTLN